jgi:hypothetical protein
MLVETVGRPMMPDEVSLEVTRSGPARSASDAECLCILLSGFVSLLAESDVRIQLQLRLARVATTITLCRRDLGYRLRRDHRPQVAR